MEKARERSSKWYHMMTDAQKAKRNAKNEQVEVEKLMVLVQVLSPAKVFTP
jgi:hypothetical protein